MEVRRPAPREGSEPAADAGGGAACFGTSLRELRDLHSHLHHAADHCEAAYGRAAARKGMVVENTRKYVCDAVVRVVDHLGSAAASLESRLLWNPEMAEMEQRIACLNQRILTCQHYAFIIDLEGLRINPELPRHLPRYVFPPSSHQRASFRRDVSLPCAAESLPMDDGDEMANPTTIQSAEAGAMHQDANPVQGMDDQFLTNRLEDADGLGSDEQEEKKKKNKYKNKKRTGGSYLPFLRRNRRMM